MDGFPNVVVNELVVQKQTNLLYAGTHGGLSGKRR